MKKILFVAFAMVQSLALIGQIKTNEVQVENREDTKVETPLKIQADNINDIGVVEIDGIANTSQNNWVRGSILFSRDGDLDWDQSSLNWTLGGGGNNDFAAIIHDSSGDLRFFSGPAAVGGFSLSNADFRSTYEHLTILGNGNVGVGNTAPRYKLEVGAQVREKGSSADQDADIMSNGGITISRNKLLTFDEGHKAHANMSYVSSGGEIRFKQQGYYGFNFVTRSNRSSLVIKGDDGYVGIGTTTPAYKLQVGGGVASKAPNADQNADIYSTGGITVQDNKFLSLDDGYKVHANMTYQNGSSVQNTEGRFKLQGYYGFRFITRNTTEALMIKGNNGFVGIHNTNPQAQLHVNGAGRISSNNPIIRFEELDNTTHGRWELSANGGRFRVIKTDNQWGNRVDLFTVRGSSTFVGISELNPQAQLHVNGESGIKLTNDSASPDARMMIKPSVDVSSLNPGYTTAGAQITNRYFGHLVMDIRANDDNDAFAIRTDADKNGVVDKIAMVVKPSGDVGIGVTNPQEKLHVNGKIKTAANTWSDFVFEDSYELPDLEEVESHIDTHGHLKDIPAEAEILEEGYVLGDMDAKLLQKIEELTLYLIEQNKEMKDLKARLEKAEKALNEVRND